MAVGAAAAIEKQHPSQRRKPAGSEQVISGQPLESPSKIARKKRLHELAPGVLDRLDAALEYQADHEHPAFEYGARGIDAVYYFSRKTRRMVRQLQTQIRDLERRIA